MLGSGERKEGEDRDQLDALVLQLILFLLRRFFFVSVFKTPGFCIQKCLHRTGEERL